MEANKVKYLLCVEEVKNIFSLRVWEKESISALLFLG
jgi:hypothetical protein